VFTAGEQFSAGCSESSDGVGAGQAETVVTASDDSEAAQVYQ